MNDVQVGDMIGYWENFRANGKIGGWEPRHCRGLVVKVNVKTIHVKRQFKYQLSDAYYWSDDVDIIPRERCYAL